MKIGKIRIENFRRLKNEVTLDMAENVLIVGKNNTGKTSVFEAVEKFLVKGKNFRFEDFNSASINKELINKIYDEYKSAVAILGNEKLDAIKITELEELCPKISLELEIMVEEQDNLNDIKELLYEFDNNENIIVKCKYNILKLTVLIKRFEEYNQRLISANSGDGIKEQKEKNSALDFYNYFKRNFASFYDIKIYSTKDKAEHLQVVDVGIVRNLFNIGIITAQREVDDTSEESTHNISNAIWEFYNKVTKQNKELDQEDTFKTSIEEIKSKLNENYQKIFSELLDEIETNILNTTKNQNIEITSDFSIENMLKRNSKLKYSVDDVVLPESYNGLGYSNMLYIFIQIVTYKNEVENQKRLFNILFIEEPESHLHPQMQSTFLSRIENILGKNNNIYKVITTHSSYILQSADLISIRYFLDKGANISIKSLEKYSVDNAENDFEGFLRKYFKINTCDLFFADKAILVEGTVERMLMPLLVNKYDSLMNNKNQLSKQHITVVEVGGAYAHIFNSLLEFLEIKTLIITDIDSVSGRYNLKCKCDIICEQGTDCIIKTSNPVIKSWFEKTGEKLYIKQIFNNCKSNEAVLIKKDFEGNEIKRIAFQLPTSEVLVWGRTFEEQLIFENSENFAKQLKDEGNNLESMIIAISQTKKNKLNELDIKNITEVLLRDNAFEIVQNLEKTDLAFDLLSNGCWNIPNYIKEGLTWLQK